MIEVEVKFAGVDFGPVQRMLRKWGARADPPRRDADHYFNAPDRDFARTDEALRLRRIGRTNLITYKGPKLDLETKSRTEIEVPLAEGKDAAEEFARLITSLGYRPVAVVKKRRRIHHLKRHGFAVEVSLDDVEDLGRFLELEVLTTEKKLPAARALVQRLAAELGLTVSERRSYLELLLAGREEKGS